MSLFTIVYYFFNVTCDKYFFYCLVSENGNKVLCQGKDVFERMNFLYQVKNNCREYIFCIFQNNVFIIYWFLLQASQSFVKKDVVLSSFYGDMLTKCSKRAVLRLYVFPISKQKLCRKKSNESNILYVFNFRGTEIKRSICKVCQSPLIPGQTANVRLKSKPTRCVVWRCLTCNSTKKYPTKQGYKLWSENNEAVIQEYNYGKMLNKKHGLVEEISKKETEESNKKAVTKTADVKS